MAQVGDAPIRFNPWIIAMTVTLATFMEVLDTSIANVALPHIAGNLGATPDESTWVLDQLSRLKRDHPAHKRLVVNARLGESAFT